MKSPPGSATGGAGSSCHVLTVITTREDSRENLPTKRNPLELADLLYGTDSESELTG